MELNNTVLSLRTEKGYTQEQFAGMLGVSAAAVSKWERGNAYPDITLLPKIAEVFNVSVDYLLGYDVTCKKTISEVISEANRLRKELKSDEAEQLIKGDFDPCLDYLEKACDSALKYDSLGYDLTYSVYDVPEDASVMEEAKHRASRVMLMALNSPERDIYAPIRDTERYREIIRKLEAELSK